jgi:hypothetical protein
MAAIITNPKFGISRAIQRKGGDLGTDYDNEGQPIAYLGKEAGGELRFAGTAFLTLSGNARAKLQDRIARLPSSKAAAAVPKVRKPEWIRPEILVRVRHLKGGDTLRHASVQGLAATKGE